jgi:uncharacterized protein YlxW (UPF0749 family)
MSEEPQLSFLVGQLTGQITSLSAQVTALSAQVVSMDSRLRDRETDDAGIRTRLKIASGLAGSIGAIATTVTLKLVFNV